MSTMLINEDFEDYLDNRNYKEVENLKYTKEDRNCIQKIRGLKERILILIAVGMLVNNFVQCAVLIPLRGASGDELTPEITVFYITRDTVFLMSSPFIGILVDYVGYEIPMLMGSVIMFLSTAMLSCIKRDALFFFARIFHGMASALIEISSFAALANLFRAKLGRCKAFGFVLEFAAFGFFSEMSMLVDYFLPILDKTLFLILSLAPIAIGMYLFPVMMRLKKEEAKEFQITKPNVTPVWRLLVDPYIVLCAGALVIGNVPLAFVQRIAHLWITDDLKVPDNSMENLMWYLFFSQGLGILSTVLITVMYPGYGWLITLSGLLLESLCCFGIPMMESSQVVELLVCIISFAVGLIRCALLPNFAHLMDVRHVTVYGSAYAIASGFYSAAYVIAPLVAYLNLPSVGLPTLIVTMGIFNVLFAPFLLYLRRF